MNIRCYAGDTNTGDFFTPQIGNQYCPKCGLPYTWQGAWWGIYPPATCQCNVNNFWPTTPKLTSVTCPKCSRICADEQELHWHLKNHIQLKDMGLES
jgi:hypothetical protein